VFDNGNFGGVFKFWEEIRKIYSFEEIISGLSQDGFGIGTIYW